MRNQQIKKSGVVVSTSAEPGIAVGNRKLNMHARKEEFEELKQSVNLFVITIMKLFLASGLELGRRETGNVNRIVRDKIEELERTLESEELEELEIQLRALCRSEFEESVRTIRAEIASKLAQTVGPADFERFKSSIQTEIASKLARTVSSADFDEFKSSVRAEIAKLQEDVITRTEFSEFRQVLKSVV